MPTPVDAQHTTITSLRDYLREVTDELGIGLESCTIDHDSPISAYVALDTRHPHYPDRDIALLWDERHGWAAAIETHSGEDLIILRYLADETVVPPPHRVARFVAALHADDHTLGQPNPPHPRTTADLTALVRDGGNPLASRAPAGQPHTRAASLPDPPRIRS